VDLSARFCFDFLRKQKEAIGVSYSKKNNLFLDLRNPKIDITRVIP